MYPGLTISIIQEFNQPMGVRPQTNHIYAQKPLIKDRALLVPLAQNSFNCPECLDEDLVGFFLT